MNDHRNINVAFIFHENHWLGGRNYLRNLFSAIHALPGCNITPVIFTGMRTDNLSSDFPLVQVIRTSMLDRGSPAWFMRKAITKGASHDNLLYNLLSKHGISILSHSGYLGSKASTRESPIPTIGWIPDFQHIYLPEFFSVAELHQRDREFMDVCQLCYKVIVSSKCAQADLRSFAPQYAEKSVAIQFVANPAPLKNVVPLAELQMRYDFDSPYLLLPNQFWAHKNHRVVIQALQILKQKNEDAIVLATGVTNDYRQPAFFPALVEYAKECNVLDRFRIIGQVPFDHLVGLMLNSIAFINPSHFEGWSTTVEEAKSMGKEVLLSDIPVHREQAPERGIFFPADAPEVLAEAILNVKNSFDPQYDMEMQRLARVQFPIRQIEFGESYRRLILNCPL